MLRSKAFLLVAVLVGAAAHLLLSEPTVRFYGNPDFTNSGEVLLHKGQAFNGTAIETFPDGSTFRSTHYRKGLKHGVSEEFGTTGARRAQWNYSGGKKEGVQRGWFIEGPPKFEMNYHAGLLEGITTEWYPDGKIARQLVYENGKETAQKVLYPTGEIYSNFVLRGDRVFGLNSGQVCMDYKKDGEI
jgi:antitoxin component YwqK of YwqJK toxin-antitoxin module